MHHTSTSTDNLRPNPQRVVIIILLVQTSTTKIVLKSRQDCVHKRDSNTCMIRRMIILACFRWDFVGVLTAELRTILVRGTARKHNPVILTRRDFSSNYGRINPIQENRNLTASQQIRIIMLDNQTKWPTILVTLFNRTTNATHLEIIKIII